MNMKELMKTIIIKLSVSQLLVNTYQIVNYIGDYIAPTDRLAFMTINALEFNPIY